VYAVEKRRLPNFQDPVDCVLLDSVQSQANRMEEALQQAIDDGTFQNAGVSIPLIEVDFTPFWDPEKKNNDLTDELRLLEPVGKVSSLQAPHRIADAILRDSIVAEEGTDKGKPFRAKKESDESSHGLQLRRVSNANATALFELCPTALLFGMWDSTGPKGGLGSKFERAMVSEIVGINAPDAWKESRTRGIRYDQLGIRKDVTIVGDRMDWTVSDDPKAKGAVRASEIVHGSIPFESSNCGVTISHADQTTVISFAALRRLRFPVDGEQTVERNLAAQTALAALGLCAATLAAESGLDLRSRCLLWPTETLEWQLLIQPGQDGGKLQLTSKAAIALLKEAIEAATGLHLPWRKESLKLRPSDDLVKLVVKSQNLSIQSGGDE